MIKLLQDEIYHTTFWLIDEILISICLADDVILVTYI